MKSKGVIHGNYQQLSERRVRRPRRSQPRTEGVPAGRRGSSRIPPARRRGQARDPGQRHHREARRTREDCHVQGPLGGRPGQGPGQPRIPCPVQLSDRTLQGRTQTASLRQPLHPEVPRIRADLQEQPHHPPHRRRKGRIRLRPQGQVRQRGHALLPVLHDRAPEAHRTRHRRPCRRHRSGQQRDRIHVRPVQEAQERVHWSPHRKSHRIRRFPRQDRGYRIRSLLLHRRDAEGSRQVLRGQERRHLRIRKRRDIRHPEGHPARRQGHRSVRFQRIHLRPQRNRLQGHQGDQRGQEGQDKDLPGLRPLRQVHRGMQGDLDHPLRYRSPLRHPERAG